MAPRKNLKSKKPAAKKRVTKPRRKAASKVTNVAEYASLSEVRTIIAPGTNNLVNTMYTLMNTSLDQFTRAPLVAQAYQHYRIKYIKLTMKPPFDTFVSGSTVAVRKPYLYHMIDKAGAIPTNISLEGLKQMGARPRALDERPLTIGWRPSVLQDAMTSGGPAATAQGSAYKISPWLNTNSVSVGTAWNPSSVDHLGVYWYLAAQSDGVPPPFVYEIEVEVQFEFKKPLIQTRASTIQAVAVEFAQTNDSSDGIVGGVDGV